MYVTYNNWSDDTRPEWFAEPFDAVTSACPWAEGCNTSDWMVPGTCEWFDNGEPEPEHITVAARKAA